MGKFKVSFTTALFVFSFLICVIIAVVFVDRAPKDEFNSFYDKEAAAEKRDTSGAKAGDSGWDPSVAPTAAEQSPTAPPAAVPALTDLPIDPHLIDMAQPIPATVTATVGINPMSGRSPEDIARALMGQAGVNAQLQASEVPGMAVPQGISTPAAAAAAAAASAVTPNNTPRTFLPMQSNVQGRGANSMSNTGPQLYQTPSLTGSGAAAGGGFTNASGWSPVTAQSSPSNLIGIHKAPSAGSQGMMIGDGRIETGAQAPPGVSTTPINEGTMAVPSLQGSPASALPGSSDKPLLFPPGSTGESKWELPPAPTLRPPPIQDPDQRRSEADETPDSLNPEESSDQAFAISEAPKEDSVEVSQTNIASEPAADVAAQVNDYTLTQDAALRLARVSASLKDDTIASDKEDDAAQSAAETWKKITAAAEQARGEGLEVGAPEVEHYAAMRPDFDPAAWQLAMEDHGFSQEEIRTNLENIALSEKIIEVAFEKKVKADEIREAYDNSPSKYAKPRTIHLQEIYKARPNDEERAKKVEREMRRLQRQAASGTDFGLLARQTSEAPTAKRGGNLGWINPAEDKDSARDKALKGLESGEVTEVIEDDDGFRIYRLMEVKEAAKDFDSAKDVVVAELKKPVRKDCFKDVLKKLEAGELAPANDPATASASAPKPSNAIVATRVGSSLVSGSTQGPAASSAEAALKKALDAQKSLQASAESKEKIEKAREGSSDTSPDSSGSRKYRAQQLLGEAAAQRNAADRQQSVASNQTMDAAQSATVMHHGGQQTQLLFPPGSQPQQVPNQQAQAVNSVPMVYRGGQPQPPYQAGGQPSSPVHASMQAPTQASFNHMGATEMEPNAAAIQAAQIARLRQTAQAEAAGAVQADPHPNQTRRQSNGWNVIKTVEGPNAPKEQPAREEQMQARSQPQAPPGFGTEAQSPQAQNNQQRRGIVGSVKSFFGSLGR